MSILKQSQRVIGAMLVGGVMVEAKPGDSAPSSHLFFNYSEPALGDIQISEVRVPADGLAHSTYYETLGFLGNKGNGTGNGYGGIQESLDSRGNRVHIFSIWHKVDDPKDTANFPYVVHLGHGMQSEHFGGEGVGLKTWKLTSDKTDPLYWKTGVWYTHLVRCWPVGEETHYGFFVRDGMTGIWRHLSTVGVKEKNIRLQGGNDAFIEDWGSNGGTTRRMHLRSNWRRTTSGKWLGAGTAKFSVNSWDLKKGGRSFLHQDKWNAGVKRDATGAYYFMEIGGEARSQKPLAYPEKTSALFSVNVVDQSPRYEAGKLKGMQLQQDAGKLKVKWSVEEKGLPQFGYSLDLLGPNLNVLESISKLDPHVREHTFDLRKLDRGKDYQVRLSMRDVFDQKSEPKELTFRKQKSDE
ncbi:DUF3472 domain-containing protein [Rubritalea tangerina]|uniref:DUF3472 domain-containing protein n=2 Tax=Rubritalea tangerina TaxID=430798 RepID=A0ABW4ZBV0_9BACT